MPKHTMASPPREHMFTSQLKMLSTKCPRGLQVRLFHAWSHRVYLSQQSVCSSKSSKGHSCYVSSGGTHQQQHDASSTLGLADCRPQLPGLVFSRTTWCGTNDDCCSRNGHV